MDMELKMLLSYFLLKKKTAYDMRIRDWSSDVCSSDLLAMHDHLGTLDHCIRVHRVWREALEQPDAPFGSMREDMETSGCHTGRNLVRDLLRSDLGLADQLARERVQLGAGRALGLVQIGADERRTDHAEDRKSVVEGKSVSVRVDLG